MPHRTQAARPLVTVIGVALSLTLLAPAGLSPATAAPATAQTQNVASFTDVSGSHVFYDEISWMGSSGISNGWTMPDGTRHYRPAQHVLRDQMAAFMYRLAGSPDYTPPETSPFTDVRPGQVFYKEISWLAENGISTGWSGPNGARTFGPGRPVARDQMAAFMYRLAGSPDYTAPATSKFTDVRPGQGFYKEISWLAQNGISTGWSAPNNTRIYGPGRSVLRDQMAAFMYRLNDGGHLDHHTAGQELKVQSRGVSPTTVGTSTTWSFTATGGTAPYNYERIAGTLPEGMNLQSYNGQLTGTPTRAGEYELTVKVTDGTGQTATTTVVLTVNKRDLSQSPLLSARTVDTHTEGNLVVKTDGTVWEWKTGPYGQDRQRPARKEGITNAKQAVVGKGTTYVLRTDGTVWGWGYNTNNELANPGAGAVETIPVRVGNLTDVAQVATAGQTGYALKSDGTVWSWGGNDRYLLGIGRNDMDQNTIQPQQIKTLSNVTSLSASEESAYAVTGDGSAWAWGWNNCGQLGDGTTNGAHTPKRVTNLTGVKSISAGDCEAFATKTDGTVWHWGQKTCRVWADGTIIRNVYPTRVAGLSDVRSVAAGECNAVAVKNDSTVWAWGLSNNRADLGTGTWHEQTPVQLTTLSDITAVEAGAGATYATASDGTLWGWGRLGIYYALDAGDGLVFEPTALRH